MTEEAKKKMDDVITKQIRLSALDVAPKWYIEELKTVFTSGYQVARDEVTAEAEKLAEALRKIAEYSTSEEKYNSYEQGWHGVADFAAKELDKWKEFRGDGSDGIL